VAQSGHLSPVASAGRGGVRDGPAPRRAVVGRKARKVPRGPLGQGAILGSHPYTIPGAVRARLS
jgi:hypothetical protein